MLRASALTLSTTLVLAACGSTDITAGGQSVAPTLETTSADVTPVTVEQVEASPPAVTVSGLDIVTGESAEGAPPPLVDPDDIRSGGPPPDGIPSIDEPRFLAPDAVDFLAENEPVLAVEVGGDARAYPIQILMWHELVNDTIGGTPVTVSYCPLCNSAVAYDRRVDDLVLEFGTSGRLWNSALVMYDRQTETLWSHFTAQGIVGELTGVKLETLPVATVPWGVWRAANPDGLVLSRDTGFERDYGRNPYLGYDAADGTPFLFEGEVDGRYTAMTRMVGVEIDGDAVGVPLAALRDDGVIPAELGGTDLVFFWQTGTASALDANDVADGADVGSTGVFVPEIDGRPLTFTATDDGFADTETGSTWNLFGEAVSGELAGAQLRAVPHVDTFWFAWAAFLPDTEIVDP
ncbi:MAG TPA: DUF3179 domain-containing protein [Ilumatobacteraceae bacterium]|nr:DUF3179 domain-containing protein [Ilumatobacteraceae bacterium]